MARGADDQDELYARVSVDFGPALARLARAYERDPSHAADLLQEINVAVWRSLALFDGRCSVKTWIYRVAHNTGASHILKQKRRKHELLIGIEDLETIASDADQERDTSERSEIVWLMKLINALKMPDQQIMLLYLEELDAATIGEIVGLSSGAVATKIHRIKAVLAQYAQSRKSQYD